MRRPAGGEVALVAPPCGSSRPGADDAWPTESALEAAAAALGRVDHAARQSLSHEQRLALIEATWALCRQLEALLVAQVGEADRLNSAMAAERTPLASWLQRLATHRGEAARLIHAARELTRFEAVRASALAGGVSVAQVRAIGGVLAELDGSLTEPQQGEAQRLLVERARSPLDGAACQRIAAEVRAGGEPARVGARGQTAEELAKSGREILGCVAPGVLQDPERDLEAQRQRAVARRSLAVWEWDGSTYFKGNLPSVEGASLIKLVAAHLEEDRRERKEAVPRVADGRTMEQRRADAFTDLLAAQLRHQGSPNVGGDRPRVVVLLSYDRLRDAAEQGVLDTGQHIGVGDLRRLCCDAEIIPAVLGGDSALLEMGRARRLVTPEQRQALAIRDRGCVFPDCDRPPWMCDAHHLLPWLRGGRTNVDEMALLCPTHHALVEPRGPDGLPLPTQWRLAMDPISRTPRCFPPRE